MQQQPPPTDPHASPQAQQEQPYYPPTSQQYQQKILILQCNTYLGSQLLEAFRNDDLIQVNPNIIYGTLNKHVKNVGNLAVNVVLQAQDTARLSSVVKQADIIVYALNQANARLFQYIVKLLIRIKHESSTPKRLICISSLLTWNAPRSHQPPTPSTSHLSTRNSTNSYLVQLQNLCLSLNNLSNNIESYVVCTGLVYGNGQQQLFKYFKKALQQSQPLKIYGNGKNHIPMVHVNDLCGVVFDIGMSGHVGEVKREDGVKGKYYFVVDSAKATQQEIIKCIADNLGNGKVQSIPVEQAFVQQNYDLFTVNMQINELPTLKNWHTIGGFIPNIATIISQFNLYRGLKPNKIFISGPPAAGKSKIAQILQKAYGLPVLTVKKVLEQLNAEESQFATQIKIKLEQIRTQKVEEQKKIFQQAKKKKKGKKDAVDQFDPSKIVPRLPDDQLLRVFKKRLMKSDCMNKGYILDGWPKTSKYCQLLFTNDKKQIEPDLLPNAVFNIVATEEEVKERVKALPQAVKETTHHNQEGTARRFQLHNKANQEGLPKVFFNGKVDIKDVPFNYEGVQQFIKFIERNGPLGFKKKQAPKQPDTEDANKGEQPNEQKPEEQENQQGEQQQNQAEQPGQFDLQKLTQHEKQILNEKSRPIRQYLIDNVIPQITEGLLEICKETPRDPVGFLIKFLENKEALKNKGRK